MPSQDVATTFTGNTHGLGFIQPGINTKVFINNVTVSVIGDTALADSDCRPKKPPIHCTPNVLEGSAKVFIKNIGVHRGLDRRICGAKTVPIPKRIFAG